MENEITKTYQLGCLYNNICKLSGIELILNEYNIEITEEDKTKQRKLEKKENIKLFVDFTIALILFPALSGFIGWLLPLQYSIIIVLFIGVIDIIWFIGRRM